AVGRLQELGGAQEGDATMMDALIPAAATLTGVPAGELDPHRVVPPLLRSAEEGTEATTGVVAGRGRSSYVGERAVGTPDPGAVAVSVGRAAVRRPWSGR